jgi:putative molybdopterin biosynthesis protein
LIVAPGNPLGVTGLVDVVGRQLRFASREEGSGTYLLGEHLAHASGLDPRQLLTATVENSHIAVAMAVASGLADAALGLEAAARVEGLGFVPLVDEEYFLVCLEDALEQPAVRALREVLSSPAWRQAVAARAGYAAAPTAGQVLSLTRALPWWRFRSSSTSMTARSTCSRVGISMARFCNAQP